MSRKKRQESSYDDEYENLLMTLEYSNLPILTLSKKWYDLFSEGKNREIKRLEKELNESLKEQGKINSERDELNKLKQTLMKKIMDNMDAGENSRADMQIKKCRDLIEDINEKLGANEERERSLPRDTRRINAELAMAGMDVLCETTVSNKEDIIELDEEIETMRIELKKKVLEKQQKVEENQRIHAFLYDVVGAENVLKFEELKAEWRRSQ